MSIYLGIDTSNYTTSFAVCGDKDYSVRRLLDVPFGARGIRQSDGVFMHTKNAPELYRKLSECVPLGEIKAVGVSTRPRSVEGSYMPVFVSGSTYASLIADTLGVPLYTFSHQDGHIMAGIASSEHDELLSEEFHCVHLSGGTCEILKTRYEDCSFICDIEGGTLDISAGQLIDRVGVALGMKFPCGRELTQNAIEFDGDIYKLSVSVRDGYINFSGAEAQSMRLIRDNPDKKRLSASVLNCIGKSLVTAFENIGAKKILMVGGVAASDYLKKYLLNNCTAAELIFAKPEFSTDNAWGIAKLTERRSIYGT